jgi:predicted dehydrogenase
MNEKLGCVMVGLGGRGQHLLKQVLQNDNYEVVALAEPNAELLEKARQIANMPESACYTDLDAVLGVAKARVCVINTPPQLHAEHLEMAFSHNLSALVAKPLTRNLEDAQRVVQLADEKGLALIVDQQQRFRPVEQTIARWIAEGKFGELGFGTYTFHRNRPEMLNATDENPFIWEQGVHCFNSLLAMLGRRVVSVSAGQVKPSWSNYNGATVVMGEIEFEGASPSSPTVPVQFMGSYASKVKSIEVHLEFAQAAVKLEEGYRSNLLVAKDGESYIPVPVEEAGEALLGESLSGEQQNLNNLYRAIHEGCRVPNDGHDNLQTLAVADAFIQSAREGRRISVDSFEPVQMAK